MKYLLLTIKHKWYVLLIGLKLKANLWDLVCHDLSKFTPEELPHYQRQFFGSKDQPLQFTYAWNHHQKHNKHHWEYWIPVTGHSRGGYSDGQPIPMPERYVREMVADWMGAGRAYDSEYPNVMHWEWFDKNQAKIMSHCHPDTKEMIFKVLSELVPVPSQTPTLKSAENEKLKDG